MNRIPTILVVAVSVFGMALCPSSSSHAAAPPALAAYGLNLIGTDPYQGLPSFYSAYPDDYPVDAAPPARPTSYWHRWYRVSPALIQPSRDARVLPVERPIQDFETDSGMQFPEWLFLWTDFRPSAGVTTAFSAHHASEGARSFEVIVTDAGGDLPVFAVPVTGDAQMYFDNWRWLTLHVFNPTSRRLTVGFSKDFTMARKGFGPSFTLQPGPNKLTVKTAELDGYFWSRWPSSPERPYFYLFMIEMLPGETLYFDDVRFMQEVGETLSTKGRLFNFGDATNQLRTEYVSDQGGVFPGWTGVSSDTFYTPQRGFGWDDWRSDPAVAEGRGLNTFVVFHRYVHSFLADFVYDQLPTATFRVDLPSGQYGVWLIASSVMVNTGGSPAHGFVKDRVHFLIQGQPPTSVRADTPDFAYDLDLIKGENTWYRYARRASYNEYWFTVTVSAGQLALDIHNPDWWSYGPELYGMAIYPLADAMQAEKEIEYFKAVTLSEAATASRALIQPAYMEHVRYAGMHDEFVHPERLAERIEALRVTAEEQSLGYVLFTRPFTEPVYFDTVPSRAEVHNVGDGLRAAGAPGQFIPLNFAVFPLQDFAGARVVAGDLRSDQGRVIPASAFDIRVERYDERVIPQSHENNTPYVHVPVFQVKRLPVALESGLTRRFVADLRLPSNTVPGKYKGALWFRIQGGAQTHLPVEIDVLPFTLSAPDVFFALPGPYHPLFVEYGFNTMRLDESIETAFESAAAKGLKGFIWLTWSESPEEIISRVNRTKVQNGVAGRGPRLFYTSLFAVDNTGTSGYHDPAGIARLRAAIPELDVLSVTAPILYMNDFDYRWGRTGTLLTRESVVSAQGQSAWFFDGQSPVKEIGGRFTYGFYFWRSGLMGRAAMVDPLVYYGDSYGPGAPPSHPFPGLNGWVLVWYKLGHSSSGGAFLMDTPDGQLSPARDLVNLREGITDYKYIFTLEQTIADAERQGRLTPAVRAAKAYVANLRQQLDPDLHRYFGTWGGSRGLVPGALDGAENWYLQPDSPIVSSADLDRMRADIIRHLIAIMTIL